MAFAKADLNRNGVITMDELRRCLKTLIPEQQTITTADLKVAMLAFDTNRNGRIEEKEFV